MDFLQSQTAYLPTNNSRGLSFLNLHFYIILPLLCLFFSSNAYATKQSILVISDNKIKIHININTLLTNILLKDKNISVTSLHYQNITPEQVNSINASLIITLGSNASKLAPPSSIPTIYALIPKRNQQKIESSINNTYTIYLDQPIARQLNFLSLLLPSANKIGVLTAPFSSAKLPELITEAKRSNLSLHSGDINHENDLNKELNRLIKNIDALLALPDPLIHNRENIPFLLLSTYRYNIPVIGFSKAYVAAGAIAAIYSSPPQIVQQISELSRLILNNHKKITSHFFNPQYYSIAINKSVVNSLDIHLPNIQTIKNKLLSLEK